MAEGVNLMCVDATKYLQQILGRIDWSHHFPLCQDEKSTIDLRTDVMVMAETATAFRQYYIIAQKVLLLLLLELSICFIDVPRFLTKRGQE